MSSEVTDVFNKYQEYLNQEQEVREEIRVVVRDLDQTARLLLTVLQAIHHKNGADEITAICKESEPIFKTVREHYKVLASTLPNDEYYRYHDHWRFSMQRVSFLAALQVYLKSEQIITRAQVAEMLGVKESREQGFHIDLEDFLVGLLTLASELARFAVNSVTAGDFSRPIRISKFIGDLHSGFKVLNLKNDMLRKRFDGLKYDVKKVEEVVYDLSIRGLKPKETE